MNDLPAAILAASVWTYWACVVALVIRSHLRFRTAAGAVPCTTRERWMWRLWIPVILLWQVLPLWGASSSHWLWGLPPLAKQPGFQVIRWTAAAVGVLAFL